MSEVPSDWEITRSEQRPPLPSASLMITRDGEDGVEILICRRVESMPSFPGYWAFPGGGISRVDKAAAEVFPTLHEDPVMGASFACMLRELVEELGWVISEGKITLAEEDARKLVLEDKAAWLNLATESALPVEVNGLRMISKRTTPAFAPMRFENRFLHFHAGAICDTPSPQLSGQTEFDQTRWLTTEQILEEWENHSLKLPPPLVTLLQKVSSLLAIHVSMEEVSEVLSKEQPGERSIMFANGVECLPLPTHTLPPASTTNCYILGEEGGPRIIVDAAAKTPEALKILQNKIDLIEQDGGEIIATIFTHRHSDHIGDLSAISNIYQAPIWASAATHKYIPNCDTDKVLKEGDSFTLSGPKGDVSWNVHLTPGHCEGHVCLSSTAGIVVGDMVAGIGTILIPPAEGDMNEYLHQLERLKSMKPHLLFPSHGPVLPLPEKTLNHYIKHRNARHERVAEAVKLGLTDLQEIADFAYADTPNAHPQLKVQQTQAHLIAWKKEGHEKVNLILESIGETF
ncbi:MAG: MBL fold metallo-hydrolase [Euryarchaeota archaeon]|jgi:glyoxylase-like metal-dependent hydrolase (beta-lactamase superfamily II)/8-oxo-dGTP pyrophosphatase MutT (NUDIX family)|nr:MBL fold metallo-hydrolase [Euryarchaeota archaeon]